MMNRRRLYVNGRFLSQPRTGVQRYASELLRQWDHMLIEGEIDPASNEIVILTPRGGPETQSFERITVRPIGTLKGNLWEQIDLPRFTGGRRLLNPCNSGPWIKRYGQAVTVHDASVFAVPQAYSLLFRVKHQVLYRRFAKTAAPIITVSEFSKGELMRWCRMPPERLRVIYSGGEHILEQPADSSALDRFNLAHRPYVLAVGSNSTHKNLAAVLQLPDLLNDVDFSLVIVGGTYGRVFQQVRYETSGNVHWLGFVTDAELRALYERASVLVYPSFYEGFGFPALEAMTCGCPVVLSNAASLPEIGGTAALYCDPKDVHSLAGAVRRIVEDGALRRQLVSRGLEQARLFSWRSSARHTWDALG
jgi:glycosyltransferase involved in cell wall biosynthesis